MAKYINELHEKARAADPRDDDGLTAKQRKFLGFRADSLSDKDALRKSGFDMAALLRWKADPSFQQAYEELVPTSTYEDVQRGLDALLPEALRLLEDALDGKELTKSQRWVVEKLFRAKGLEKVVIQAETTQVPFEAKLALAMAERGMALPPVLRDLLARYFPQMAERIALPSPEIVEASSTTIIP